MGKTGETNNQRATGRVSLGSVAIVADPFFEEPRRKSDAPQSFFK
jgi:hypothetical protein